MKPLLALINELETKIPFIEQKKESVSQASVGWHMEHSLLALIKMVSGVEQSNPDDYKWKFNFSRNYVLMFGKIPRGRAKVPDSVRPGEEINIATITSLFEKARLKAGLFEKLDKKKFLKHPYFGDVRQKQAHKVIAIHTLHHLNIINDIMSG